MSGKIENFYDLKCWQEARQLVKMVYNITRQDLFARDFGFKDQIQKSSISIMSNIAEGFETASDKDFVRFLSYSVRSNAELQSQLYAALDIGYISKNVFDEITAQSKTCIYMVKALIKYLNKS